MGLMTPDCVSKDATAPDALAYCQVLFIASRVVIVHLCACVCCALQGLCLLVIHVIWVKWLWGHWCVCVCVCVRVWRVCVHVHLSVHLYVCGHLQYFSYVSRNKVMSSAHSLSTYCTTFPLVQVLYE